MATDPNIERGQAALRQRRADQGIEPRPEDAGDRIQREVDADIERRNRSKAPAVRLVTPPAIEQEDDDAYDPRVAPGLYDARFVKAKRVKKLHGRDVWFVYWRLTCELHSYPTPALLAVDGVVLRMFLTALLDGQKPGAGHAVTSAFVQATGLRPPGDLYRHKPGWFLEDCVFSVKVREVKKDRFGAERPEAARYSRVQNIHKRVAGAPPCLMQRGGSDGSGS